MLLYKKKAIENTMAGLYSAGKRQKWEECEIICQDLQRKKI